MSTPSHQSQHNDFIWVAVTAAGMSLGWGLRGYIGGGPFGAMIPGLFVSLLICRYLGYGLTASSVVVAFGTIGIGFGGNMTYGQTLGLIRESETFLHGLAGTSLKGAVWGLLGGAMLGLGLAARQLSWRDLVIGIVALLCGIVIGLQYINVPQLLYFSNPEKPRDESWAGLLLGAVLLLCWIQVSRPKLVWMPCRFAVYGAVGGGLGFGIGSLFLTLQANLSPTWSWLPCWKFMEFFFGLLFGAALGLCAVHLRERLTPLGLTDESTAATDPRPSASRLEMIPAAVLVLCAFYTWRYYGLKLVPQLYEVGRAGPGWTAADVLIDFTGMGCALLLLSRRWQTVAWQVAVTITIVATAIDWQRDLGPRGNIEWSLAARVLFVLAVAGCSIVWVQQWQLRTRPLLMSLFLFSVCVLMGVGYMMGLGHADIWFGNVAAEQEAGGRAAFLWQQYRGEVIVHSIFTTLFAISVWFGLRERRVEALVLQGSGTEE